MKNHSTNNGFHMGALSPQRTQRGRFFLRCAITIAYTLLIFALLPFFPTLWGILSRLFPGALPGALNVLASLLVLFLFIFFFFFKKNRDPVFYLWSGVFLLSYIPLVHYYCKYPAERFHLFEYGLLVVLAHRALRLRIKKGWITPAVVMLYALCVGMADELVQGVLPNRVYEFKDVIINWISSFLALGLTAGATWTESLKKEARRNFRKWAAVIVPVMILSNAALLYFEYRRPPLNVILLTVDTLKPDHMSCYGYGRNTTPFIDRIAGRGVLFENAVASAPWTSPGMISIFTGLYPTLHGVQARGQGLLPDTPTLFKIFKDHGYKAPDIAYLTEITNFSNLGLDPEVSGSPSMDSQPGQEMLRWLDRHHREKFVLWYHYRFLHLPYNPPAPFNVFLTEEMKPRLESKALKTVLTESVIPYNSISFTPQEQEAVIALYDGRLRELDHFLKRLHQRLNQWKLHRKTLLVITGDHGEELFEHGFLGHASTAVHSTLYDEVLKIPLIFYAPSRFKGGLRMKKQVRQVDIMPTILDAAGLPLPEDLNGVSLVPRMLGREEEESMEALSESVMGGYQRRPDQEGITLRSIRTDPFKLICMDEDGEETCRLFDLSRDKEEKTDLSDVRKETAKGLSKKLKKVFQEMQARRLLMLARQKPLFNREELPKDAKLEKPLFLFPLQGSTIHIGEEQGRIAFQWTGRKDLTYVIEYDVGGGWRNLKGTIPVQGNEKVFGPLPREAWEPLPYWNPYRIRVSPYGIEEYWSDWLEFTIER